MKGRASEYFPSNAEVALEKLIVKRKLWPLGGALRLVKHDFKGKKRKNGQNAIDHMLSIVWALWAGGIKEAKHLILALLHDDIEDTERKIASIRKIFGRKQANNVNRLTRRKGEKATIEDMELEKIIRFINKYYRRMKRDWFYRKNLAKNRLKLLEMLPPEYRQAVGGYYQRISESAICVVVKCYDKIDVMKNMAYTLPLKSQKLQIIEYEAFLALACKQTRKNNPEFADILFTGRTKAESLVDNVLNSFYLAKRLKAHKKNVRRKNFQIISLKKRLAQYEKT